MICRAPLLLALLLLAAGLTPEENVRRGNAAYERGEFDTAVAAHTDAGDRATEPGPGPLNKAAALYQKGLYREAELHYRYCLEDATGSRRTHALYGLGTALLQQGRQRGAEVLRDAVKCLEQCARRSDVSAEFADDA